MKKALFFLIILFFSTAKSQVVTLKTDTHSNQYEIRYILMNSKIDVFITNSMNSDNSMRVEGNVGGSITELNNRILKVINEDYKNHHYLVLPKHDLNLNTDKKSSDIKLEDLINLITDFCEKQDKEKSNFFGDFKKKYDFEIKDCKISKENLTKFDDLLKKINNSSFETTDNLKLLENVFNEVTGKTKLRDYSYLGYLGTNFDLVDGIKVKNLFFATNILSMPDYDNVGFYISLYGNRTTSKTDSIPNVRRNVVFDSTSVRYSAVEFSDLISRTQSDNLGAFFSLFLRKWNLSKKNSKNKIYYSPSLEIIWRRTFVQAEYQNRRLTNIQALQNDDTQVPTIFDNSPRFNYNIYDVNIAPLGFWLFHENDDISIRINMNIGFMTSYISNKVNVPEFIDLYTNFTKTRDYFYTGRLWLTEPHTGITLQAEVNNTLRQPRPFYGVTLSKAFNLDRIGSFLEPITKPRVD